MEQFQSSVRKVCETYLTAQALAEEHVQVYSTDEKTGIQAKEHAKPKQNIMQAGQVERVDPEYIRHGTT